MLTGVCNVVSLVVVVVLCVDGSFLLLTVVQADNAIRTVAMIGMINVFILNYCLSVVVVVVLVFFSSITGGTVSVVTALRTMTFDTIILSPSLT